MTPPSAQARLEALLAPLDYQSQAPVPEFQARLEADLEAMYQALPALPGGGEATRETLLEWITLREKTIHRHLGQAYRQGMEQLARANLGAGHSYHTLHAHARLIDGLIRVTFWAVLDEMAALLRLRVLEGQRELNFKQGLLPQKQARLAHLTAEMSQWENMAQDVGGKLPPDQQAYMAKVKGGLEKEVAQLEADVARLEAELPELGGLRVGRELVADRLVVFARGGYGRAELSFASDLDTGYCLDDRGLAADASAPGASPALNNAPLPPAQVAALREMVSRVETLLHGAGIDSVSQYFELGEDLSRFTQYDTLHTLPSILESRPIAGNPAVLEALKDRLWAILPEERFISRKLNEYQAQRTPPPTQFHLKEDQGGLRAIQTPLWIYAVTRRAGDWSSAGLLRQAVAEGILSVWEASTLALALAFWHQLRNFLGAASEHYYSPEARYANPGLEFPPDVFNDPLARLYLFYHPQVQSRDQVDSLRLRLAADVVRVGRALLTRALDRTIIHTEGPLVMHVHLGLRQMVHISARHNPEDGGTAQNGLPEADWRQVFSGPQGMEAVLVLLTRVAETGYDLSDGVKDALSEVVTQLPAPAVETPGALSHPEAWGPLLGRWMRAPHSHLSWSAAFEVNDPLAPGVQTLAGRLIPACNQVYFLLRHLREYPLPVHRLMLGALEAAQRRLDTLGKSHPEWAALLTPPLVEALKWAAFLHPLLPPDAPPGAQGVTGATGVTGAIGVTGTPAKTGPTAEAAIAALDGLGLHDEALQSRVRLLVANQNQMALLAQSATYFDQALAESFEMAGRQPENLLLLHLMNAAVLEALGPAYGDDLAQVEKLLVESLRILAELQGMPRPDASQDYINGYLHRKKDELMAKTRLALLVNKTLQLGLAQAVYAPLQAQAPQDFTRLSVKSAEMEGWVREILMGQRQPITLAHLREKLHRALGNLVSPGALLALTQEETPAHQWFFHAFPNRFILTQQPDELAGLVGHLARFSKTRAQAELVVGPTGAVEHVLVHTRGLERSHARVTYALSLTRFNIRSGKINPIQYADGTGGFSYYFLVSPLEGQHPPTARDIEAVMLGQAPPEPSLERPRLGVRRLASRVEFLPADHKSYLVAQTPGGQARLPDVVAGASPGAGGASGTGGFTRLETHLPLLRVHMRDEPFLFYKANRILETFGVSIQQALITTTGEQVLDYFYLKPEDFEHLQASAFLETFITLMEAKAF